MYMYDEIKHETFILNIDNKGQVLVVLSKNKNSFFWFAFKCTFPNRNVVQNKTMERFTLLHLS